MKQRFDRAGEDVGNIVKLEHVNLTMPDQRLATLFYIVGLGFTRDPYLVTGVDNMWVNLGDAQFHLPTREPQVFRGVIGLVVPDLSALVARLRTVEPRLAGTKFRFEARDGHVDVVCPWGNRMRCHAPDPVRFGTRTLGMPYLEFEVPPDTTEAIAAFYREVDVFALACEVEANGDRDGIPNVVVEAMASGLPVVSTNVSGLPECVEHGVTGLLVPERSPEALADAIGELVGNADRARALGRAGRLRVEREFAAERNVRPIAGALRDALDVPVEAEVRHAVGG